MKRWMNSESGGAVVEFAICTLILVPTALYGLYFYEVCKAKVKANEVSRYMVWEMATTGLSDWKSGNHAGKFTTIKNKILQEIKDKYGDDLDGATCQSCTHAPVQGYKVAPPITVDYTIDASGLNDAEADPFKIGDFDGADSIANGILGHFGFNMKGKADGDVAIKAKNKFLGKTMSMGYTEDALMKQELVLHSKQSLIVDQWDLKQGTEVFEDKYLGGCTKDYCYQVSRMVFGGLANGLGDIEGAMSGASEILALLQIHNPITGIVASRPMKGYKKGPAPTNGYVTIKISKPPKHSIGNLNMQTGPFKDMFSDSDSEYTKTYMRLGNYYMGCPDVLKYEVDPTDTANSCQYPSK